MHHNNNQHLLKGRQEQMLKLVAQSFYRELMNYGVESTDIVTVSLHLLDHVTENRQIRLTENGYYNRLFTLQSITDTWKTKQLLQIDLVSICPLSPPQTSQVCQWLQHDSIQETFIRFFPRTDDDLKEYFFNDERRHYFSISANGTFVGLIGAENLDQAHQKLEMKKFIGAQEFSSQGIGKRATFLFLYYVFMILKFNKVYIHSMDTNIRNININSKFGFELEGIFFQDINRSGTFYDVVRMGLLRNNWLSIFSSST